MQFRKYPVFAFCIFFTILATCQTSAWKEYVYAKDGFAISAPDEPTMEARTVKGEKATVEMHLYSVDLQDADATVMYGPAVSSDKRTVKQTLDDAKNGVAFSGAKLISEKPITLGKYSGLELETEDAQSHQMGHFYAVDGRVYMLAVSVPKGKPFPDVVHRWYESFRLVDMAK